jgi:hypothetical protein
VKSKVGSSPDTVGSGKEAQPHQTRKESGSKIEGGDVSEGTSTPLGR